jgi:hypothetical protein
MRSWTTLAVVVATLALSLAAARGGDWLDDWARGLGLSASQEREARVIVDDARARADAVDADSRLSPAQKRARVDAIENEMQTRLDHLLTAEQRKRSRERQARGGDAGIAGGSAAADGSSRSTKGAAVSGGIGASTGSTASGVEPSSPSAGSAASKGGSPSAPAGNPASRVGSPSASGGTAASDEAGTAARSRSPRAETAASDPSSPAARREPSYAEDDVARTTATERADRFPADGGEGDNGEIGRPRGRPSGDRDVDSPTAEGDRTNADGRTYPEEGQSADAPSDDGTREAGDDRPTTWSHGEGYRLPSSGPTVVISIPWINAYPLSIPGAYAYPSYDAGSGRDPGTARPWRSSARDGWGYSSGSPASPSRGWRYSAPSPHDTSSPGTRPWGSPGRIRYSASPGTKPWGNPSSVGRSWGASSYRTGGSWNGSRQTGRWTSPYRTTGSWNGSRQAGGAPSPYRSRGSSWGGSHARSAGSPWSGRGSSRSSGGSYRRR